MTPLLEVERACLGTVHQASLEPLASSPRVITAATWRTIGVDVDILPENCQLADQSTHVVRGKLQTHL
jgi:hypothetical protein